jgi:hypothetical protein
MPTEDVGDAAETDPVELVAPSPCEPSCEEGEYCDGNFACYSCDYIEPSRCDFVGGDCCSAEFLQSCPSDPAECNEASPLVYALVFMGSVGLVVLVVRCVRSRRADTSAEKQYALVSTGAGDDAWDRCAFCTCLGNSIPCRSSLRWAEFRHANVCSTEQATLINGISVEARAVSVDRTGTEQHDESPAEAKNALDLPEILPTDFGSVRNYSCASSQLLLYAV